MQLPYELPWLQQPYEYDHGYNYPMSMTMVTTALWVWPWLQQPYEYDHGYNYPMSMTMVTTTLWVWPWLQQPLVWYVKWYTSTNTVYYGHTVKPVLRSHL